MNLVNSETDPASPTQDADLKKDWWVAMGAYICLRIAEALNPTFYNLG